jgi:hypothetical protein
MRIVNNNPKQPSHLANKRKTMNKVNTSIATGRCSQTSQLKSKQASPAANPSPLLRRHSSPFPLPSNKPHSRGTRPVQHNSSTAQPNGSRGSPSRQKKAQIGIPSTTDLSIPPNFEFKSHSQPEPQYQPKQTQSHPTPLGVMTPNAPADPFDKTKQTTGYSISLKTNPERKTCQQIPLSSSVCARPNKTNQNKHELGKKRKGTGGYRVND